MVRGPYHSMQSPKPVHAGVLRAKLRTTACGAERAPSALYSWRGPDLSPLLQPGAYLRLVCDTVVLDCPLDRHRHEWSTLEPGKPVRKKEVIV